MPESFRGFHPGHRQGYAAGAKARHLGSALKLFGRRANGTEFPADIALSPMNTEDGMLVMAAMRDRTSTAWLKRIEHGWTGCRPWRTSVGMPLSAACWRAL